MNNIAIFFQKRIIQLLNSLDQREETDPNHWIILGRLRECYEIGKRMKLDRWEGLSYRKDYLKTGKYKRLRLSRFDRCTSRFAHKVRIRDIVKASKDLPPKTVENIGWLFES